jgi:pyruvate carboxylase subunit B
VKYVVTVGGREIEVEVDGDRVRVDGREFTASLAQLPGAPVRLLTIDGATAALACEPLPGGGWGLGWHGERFDVEVLDERTRHIRSLTARSGAAAGPATLRAPMPGLVVRLGVEVGQPVAAGVGVVVLEAMKMENELKAAGPGIVRTILVRPGQAVEKGQPLVEFEAAP